LGADSRLWLANEISNIFSQPVVAPRIAIDLIHALLNDCPGAIGGIEKTVMIKLIAILDSSATYLLPAALPASS